MLEDKKKTIELIDEDFVGEVVDLPELVYDGVEMYGMVSGHHKNHNSQHADSADRSNHTSKSLFRRVFNLLKQTWTGVKFSLGKSKLDLRPRLIVLYAEFDIYLAHLGTIDEHSSGMSCTPWLQFSRN